MTIVHLSVSRSCRRAGWGHAVVALPARLAAAFLLVLGLAGVALAEAAAPPPAQPPATTAPLQVDGFRSARWGMTEAKVKAAIRQDFGLAADKIHAEDNLNERTKVFTITVNDLLQGTGKARISYILGYATKKLIEVNIEWGTPVDPHVEPGLVVAAANQLRTLFLTSGYQPGTIASNVATGAGTMVVFQGEDAEKHMTLLRLVSTPAPVPGRQHRAAEATGPTVVLLLSYIENSVNPDIYRLKKGQF